MVMRRDFYNRNKVYLPRDPISRGVVPDDYHIFAASDAISICLYYECEKVDKKVKIHSNLSQRIIEIEIFFFTEYTRKT